MGFDHHSIYRAPACPGCGKPDAARMSHSVWGHSLSCCSEACGMKVADALAEMRESRNYRFFTDMRNHAEDQLANLQSAFLEDLRTLVGRMREPQERADG